jgi:transcription elongation factor Elf1
MVMVNELLVNLVNGVLGTGKRTARGNQSFHCPFCNHHKPKLEVNFTEDKDGKNRWACWTCNKKGQTIYSLFKQMDVSPEIISQLKPLVKSGSFVEKSITYNILELPKEFKKFDNSIISKHALNYLKKRNITQSDIIKYGMGYCEYGLYSKMIVIPSYDATGKLNYFTARSFEKDPYIKYRNPETSRDIIPFELFINWDLPIILCEGPFDAMAIKRNVIPLFGKNIQSSLMKKIVSSKVQKIYIALDNDAINKALEFCETLLDEGKEVYLVELEGKDPSEMGFEHFTKLIQKTTPLTNYKLMEKKLQMV